MAVWREALNLTEKFPFSRYKVTLSGAKLSEMWGMRTIGGTGKAIELKLST